MYEFYLFLFFILLLYVAGSVSRNVFLELASGFMFMMLSAVVFVSDVGLGMFNTIISMFLLVLGIGIIITSVVR